MKTIAYPYISKISVDNTRSLRLNPSLGTLAWVVLSFFILGMMTLNYFSAVPGQSVVSRCDSLAVAAVGPSEAYRGGPRQWRLARKAAFELCIDDSIQSGQKAGS